MSNPVAAAAPSAPPPHVARGGWRSLLSFLIFVHLFYVLAGVLSERLPESPVTPRGPYASQLEGRLRGVPGLLPYLQTLFMDSSYRFYLTYTDPADTDHAIVVSLTNPDGSTTTTTFPPPDLLPMIRRTRYQQVARRLAEMEDRGLDDPVSIIATAYAKSAIATRFGSVEGAKSGTLGTIACRRHYCQSMPEARSPNAQDRDPYHAKYYEDVYEARLLKVGSELQLLKVEAASQTAPGTQSANPPAIPPTGLPPGPLVPFNPGPGTTAP